jgi:hypothetical protein
MKRYGIEPMAGTHARPNTPKLRITEAPEGKWVKFEDVPSKSMLEKHYAIRCQIAKDEKERADKYEQHLIAINDLIFAKGISYTGDDYWTVRGMCAEAARNFHNRQKKL